MAEEGSKFASVVSSSSANGFSLLRKKHFLHSTDIDEQKRKGGYTQYNENFARIGKYIGASSIGRFHFHCAACDADFSLAKMGPKAVVRHIQSTRHKKIVTALATNPDDVFALKAKSALLAADAAAASKRSNSIEKLSSAADFAHSLSMLSKQCVESDADTLSRFLSVSQYSQMALDETPQSNSSKSVNNWTPDDEKITRCGGTANIICDPEAKLQLVFKNEPEDLEVSASKAVEDETAADEFHSNSGFGISEEAVAGSSVEAEAIPQNEYDSNGEASSSPLFHARSASPRANAGRENEQQLFALQQEILQLKKEAIKLKCEYYRKKIAYINWLERSK